MVRHRLLAAAALSAACACAWPAATAATPRARAPAPPTPELQSCILGAAQYHSVHPALLYAILHVESRLNPGALNRNANGSYDVGIGQINSIHFSLLQQYGIAPQNLLDGCVGAYVAAWHLRKQVLAYGNTWYAVGAYHSLTPKFNASYQRLVYSALAGWGYVAPLTAPALPR